MLEGDCASKQGGGHAEDGGVCASKQGGRHAGCAGVCASNQGGVNAGCGRDLVIYAGHKGFVRLAIEQGAALVPVLALGEVLQVSSGVGLTMDRDGEVHACVRAIGGGMERIRHTGMRRHT
eukprot:scaffold4582_cov21-Tisochrysis_lutea.AAC.1